MKIGLDSQDVGASRAGFGGRGRYFSRSTGIGWDCGGSAGGAHNSERDSLNDQVHRCTRWRIGKDLVSARTFRIAIVRGRRFVVTG